MIKGIGLIAFGIIGVVFRRWASTFGQKWKYNGDIEPSEINIFFTVIGSIVLIILGIGIIINSI